MKRKMLFSIVTTALLASSGQVLAQERVSVKIIDFVAETNSEGSITIQVDRSVDLFDQDGKLLETLAFVQKIPANPFVSDTFSYFCGKKYCVVFDDSNPGASYAATRAALPPREPAKPLPKDLAIQVWTTRAEESKKLGDEKGYRKALQELKKLQAESDAPE